MLKVSDVIPSYIARKFKFSTCLKPSYKSIEAISITQDGSLMTITLPLIKQSKSKRKSNVRVYTTRHFGAGSPLRPWRLSAIYRYPYREKIKLDWVGES